MSAIAEASGIMLYSDIIGRAIGIATCLLSWHKKNCTGRNIYTIYFDTHCWLTLQCHADLSIYEVKTLFTRVIANPEINPFQQ